LMNELHVVEDRGNLWRGAPDQSDLAPPACYPRCTARLWWLPDFVWLADPQYKRMLQTR